MAEKNSRRGLGTLLIHAGERPDPVTGAIAPVLVRTKTYEQKEFGVEGAWQYSRGKNPTRSALEEKLGEIEGGGFATVFGSGVAATAMFFLSLDPGDHVLCCQEVYGGTFRLLDQVLPRFGITADYVDFSTRENIKKHIKKNTKYLFVETPTNPSLHVIDLELVRNVSEETGIPFAVDATFSPPCTTQSFEYGAETIIHSLSKYIAGHNDVIAGAVVTKNLKLHEKLSFFQKAIGAILSPDECYRVLQGVKSLHLRWERSSENAQKTAEFLLNEFSVARVLYPGLPGHPNHNVARRQMKKGFGSVVSFELKTKDLTKIKKFVEVLKKGGIVRYGESLASPETILAYPPLMSHRSLPKDVRESLGITDGFFRLSLGWENVDDILLELKKALDVL
jgi:cystathionine gamma-lyase